MTNTTEYNEEIYLGILKKIDSISQIYLISGACLKGKIVDYDDHAILIETPAFGVQLIYKHAISTITVIQD